MLLKHIGAEVSIGILLNSFLIGKKEEKSLNFSLDSFEFEENASFWLG